MAKLKLNRKIKGSTLAEATVALTIVAIISGLAMMTLVSISKSSNHQLKILAFYELEQIITQTKQSQDPQNEDFEGEHSIIEQMVSEYKNSENLKEIHYKVYSKQKKLLFERKLIYTVLERNHSENTANEFEF